jgi:retron-type reverse transcriptase
MSKTKIVNIPKKTGGFRLVVVPNSKLRRKLRHILVSLYKYAEEVCNPEIVHGFMIGKSAVTNALAHVGYKWSVCFDLEDFFNSLTLDKAKKEFQFLLRSNYDYYTCFHDIEDQNHTRVAAQGLPTSPVISNIMASNMDKEIKNLVEPKGIKYTRYADDLTFSGNNDEDIKFILETIPQIVQKHDFKINKKKTHVQHSKAGRRIITGVAVDADGIYPTRACKRRLRAAKHQNKYPQARGLEEWMKLKKPSGVPSGTKAQAAAAKNIVTNILGLSKNK